MCMFYGCTILPADKQCGDAGDEEEEYHHGYYQTEDNILFQEHHESSHLPRVRGVMWSTPPLLGLSKGWMETVFLSSTPI